jgi:hypothetical protein
MLIVPTLCVGMPPVTLCVKPSETDAERPRMHSYAERGNDHFMRARSTGLNTGVGLAYVGAS